MVFFSALCATPDSEKSAFLSHSERRLLGNMLLIQRVKTAFLSGGEPPCLCKLLFSINDARLPSLNQQLCFVL